MSSILTSEPHFLPAYTGYCPQFKYRIGESYGHLTHKLLVDPNVAHSKNLVISDGKRKPESKPKEVTNPYIDQSQRLENDIVFRDPMVSSYKGFFPRIRDKFSNRYAVSASEALVEFKKDNLKKQIDYEKMKQKIAMQERKVVDMSFRNSCKTPKIDYKLPLAMVRPEIPSTPQEPPECLPKPPRNGITRIPILFNCPPDNYHIKGSTGNRCLFQYPEFGQMSKIETQATLTDFTNNCNFRKTAEWTPVPFYHSSLQDQRAGVEIYPRSTGLLPSYQGHVPGMNHSYGKTFGAESVNAKRNLRDGICLH